MTVFILAAGKATRWQGADFKQLADIAGEPLIARTARQVRRFGGDPVVVAYNAELAYAARARMIQPDASRWTCETILSTYSHWQDRVIVLLGDVVFSAAALDTIFNGTYSTPRIFGAERELFALVFEEENYEQVKEALRAVCQHAVDNHIEDGGRLWQLQRQLAGWPLYDYRNPREWDGFTWINDYTDDLDNVGQYEQFKQEVIDAGRLDDLAKHDARAGAMIRLDIGCGRMKKDGFIGVDAFAPADVKAFMDRLPYDDDAVDEIYSSHALEHVSKHEVVPTLKEWRRVLKPGGTIQIVVPDLVDCVEKWLWRKTNDWYMDIIFGMQSTPGEYHKTGFTEDIMKGYLADAGLEFVHCKIIESHGTKSLDFAIRKPGEYRLNALSVEDAIRKIAADMGLNAEAMIAYADEVSLGGNEEGYWSRISVSGNEGRILYALVRELKPETALEIGSNSGCSATHILSAMEKNGVGHLTGVDFYPLKEPGVPEHLQHRWTFVQANAREWSFPEHIDFLFEDGDHSQDFTEQMIRNGKKAGARVMVSHDAHNPTVGPLIRAGFGAAVGAFHSVLVEGPTLGFAYWCDPDRPYTPIEPAWKRHAYDAVSLEDALRRLAKDGGLDADALIAYAAEDTHGGRGQGNWPAMALYQDEGRILYALTRAMKPDQVIEVGVDRGASAIHILAALEANGHGDLFSVDVAPEAGSAVPDDLRGRWTLVTGQDALTAAMPVHAELIFEDGPHTYEPTRKLLERLNGINTGVLLTHDYYAHRFYGEESGFAVQQAFKDVFDADSGILLDDTLTGIGYHFANGERA